MAENGFDEHKLLILSKLTALEEGQAHAAETIIEMRLLVGRLSERMLLWSAVAGMLFGGATSLLVALTARKITSP